MPGQALPQFHVEAWLPFKNCEMDYWLFEFGLVIVAQQLLEQWCSVPEVVSSNSNGVRDVFPFPGTAEQGGGGGGGAHMPPNIFKILKT